MKILTYICYLVSAMLLIPYLVWAQTDEKEYTQAPMVSEGTLIKEINLLEQEYAQSILSYENKLEELGNLSDTGSADVYDLEVKAEIIDYIIRQEEKAPVEIENELAQKKEQLRLVQFEKLEIDKLSWELNIEDSQEISSSFEPIWPLPGYYEDWVTMTFAGVHKGYDIAAHYGKDIIAVQSGIVMSSEYHYSWGNNVFISHNDNYSTRYAHMSEMLVEAGDYVEQGDIIGRVGSTGNSTGNHLHYEVYENSQRVDPYPFFNR